jgi:hypothetical protein
LLAHQLRERHRAEEREDVGVEPGPQLVRHAAPVVVTVLLAAALRRIDGLVDRRDDVGHRKAVRAPCEVVAPARPADAVHQPVAPQLAEQLLEYDSEIFCRSEIAASVTGLSDPCNATSIIAVTAKRPFVVRRIVEIRSAAGQPPLCPGQSIF